MGVESSPPPSPDPADGFWRGKTVEALAAEQGVKPWTAKTIAEMHALGKEIWPDDEFDEFLA